MIKISALNEASENSGSAGPLVSTREAQESEAICLYEEALKAQTAKKYEEAEACYHQLLETPLIQDAPSPEGQLQLPSSLHLKYMALKNLAAISKDVEAATKYLLEALDIDGTDTTVWVRLGHLALQLGDFHLSRQAFQQGYCCNSNNWICLDKLVTLLYVIGDYSTCLFYISQALEKDYLYLRGLVLRDQIYKEDPSIKVITDQFFNNCDPCASTATYSPEEAAKIVEDCQKLREQRQSPPPTPPSEPLTFQQSLKEYKWKPLGDCLVALYDTLANSEPHVSFYTPVDLSMFKQEGPPPEDQTIRSIPTAMEVEPGPGDMPSPEHCPDSEPSDNPMEGVDEEGVYEEVRRGTKRKRLSFEPLENIKRRSSRVRNPLAANVKKIDYTNYQDLLQRFLPIPLQKGKKRDEDRNKSSKENKSTTSAKEEVSSTMPPRASLAETEEADVRTFLTTPRNLRGVTYLMQEYLLQLGEKMDLLWPEDLGDTYCQMYEILRPRIEIPDPLSSDYEAEELRIYAKVILAYQELRLAKWRESTKSSTHLNKLAAVGSRFPWDYFWSDLDYILMLSARRDLLGDFWPAFVNRVLWTQAQLRLLQNNVDGALTSFTRMIDAIQEVEEDTDSPLQIHVPNTNSLLSLNVVQLQMESLQRSQSLEKVQKLFDQGDYQRVVDLLVLTFQDPAPQQQSKNSKKEDIPDRYAQLILLHDALWKLEDHKECAKWCEVAFNEALREFLASDSSTPAYADWHSTILDLIRSLNKCMKQDITLLNSINLSRFAHNLIQYIHSCFQADDGGTPNLLPWLMLYNMLVFQEKQEVPFPAIRVPELDLPPTMAPSLTFLFASHEYLGRHSWCTAGNGQMLQLCVDIMMSELQTTQPHPFREDLESGLEQCFYCLYKHPNQRAKAKHLADHSAPQIPLTWDKASQLFECFKPSFLPEFDGYRSSTISSDTENLFRRITQLIPAEEDPTPRIESLVEYIEGSTEKYPGPHPVSPGLIVRDIYYLLADFHFKNKDFKKAIKFYILDICVTGDRIDSWAGMALSRSSQLEAKLNLTVVQPDLKADPQIFKRARAALRCFKHALTIDSSHTALWIEYGSIAYLIHSYASRFLKQKSRFDYSEELVELLSSQRQQMLKEAKHCFLSAFNSRGPGAEVPEAWMQHYMLGKVAEKEQDKPVIYLNHYKKALFHLHKDGARFPRKIHYHSPAELAVESLEVYYRIHASTLKYIFKNEVDGLKQDEINAIGDLLKSIASSPFAKCQDKKGERLNQASEDDTTGSTGSKKRRMGGSESRFRRAPKDPAESNTSSAETEDCTVVKEVIQSLVTAVSALAEEGQDKSPPAGPVQVVGDAKLRDINKQKAIQELMKGVCTERCTIKDIVKMCTMALRECTVRYSQNYKAPFRLAHYYFRSKCDKNIRWAHEILLSTSSVPSANPYHPNCGLFAERKNANYFNGIWRVPSNDIDRPGGFASHMLRAVELVQDILTQQQNHQLLLNMGLQLSRMPDLGKRYLREPDRNLIYKEAFDRAFKILREKLNNLLGEEPPPAESRLISYLVEIFRAWHNLHKAGVYTDQVNDLLESAYTMYKLGEVDPSPSVLDQAIAFCQLHSNKAPASTEESSTVSATEDVASGKKSNNCL